VEKVTRIVAGSKKAALALPWLLAAVSALHGELPKPTESQVQAAYLYNFGNFIQWPANTALGSSVSFTICILGEDPFGSSLNAAVADRAVGGRAVVAKHIMNAAEAPSCQILFISSSEDTRLNKILQALNRAAVLTVSDMPAFSDQGGMVQFILKGNRVRFEVDLAAARKAGLTLSSELLKLAARVKGNSAAGGQ